MARDNPNTRSLPACRDLISSGTGLPTPHITVLLLISGTVAWLKPYSACYAWLLLYEPLLFPPLWPALKGVF